MPLDTITERPVNTIITICCKKSKMGDKCLDSKNKMARCFFCHRALFVFPFFFKFQNPDK